jgi:isoquinoline 1-oxidoreductase alpha subunit
MKLNVNQTLHDIPDGEVDPRMPLLWVLRDVLQLTGTKYGCGVAACGACTVHVDGRPQRACVTPLASVQGKAVRTIESLGSAPAGPLAGFVNSAKGRQESAAQTPQRPHPLQAAWVEHQVPQCGYCQSGMLMAAAALLATRRDPSDAEIDAAITNLCRCGSTPRVRAAIHDAARAMRPPAPAPRKPQP